MKLVFFTFCFFFFILQMYIFLALICGAINLGLLGHSHTRYLHRHSVHPNIHTTLLPGHSFILPTFYTSPTDITHYINIPHAHPHLDAILISWGDNEIDQPGHTISNGIANAIIDSLTELLLFFTQNNIPTFILPPLPCPIPTFAQTHDYNTARHFIRPRLQNTIANLHFNYEPLITLPDLTFN